MDNKQMPLKGLLIMKRLNTRETADGVDVKDTEFVFASKDYPEIIKHLVRFPRNRLSWLIVCQFEKNEAGFLEYSNGISGLDFLKNAQKHLEQNVLVN